jgi:hypothetical protein
MVGFSLDGAMRIVRNILLVGLCVIGFARAESSTAPAGD